MGLVDKLKDTLRFARFGSTRVRGLEEQAAALRADLAHAQRRADELAVQLAQSEQRFDARLSELADRSRRDIDAIRTQVGGLSAALDRSAAAAPAAQAGAPPSALALEEGFYPLLERHFRGSEADVKQRLAAYRDAVDAMPPGRVADLGCGRGEWLELLAEWRREAVGVDSNALVADDLRSRGLNAVHGDAIEWLHAQPEASLAGITAFHVVEHLRFGVLLRLLMEAHRVLAPGGSLVLETPNPENVEVATQTFWLDPTHLRPLPPQLLQLAAGYCGFEQLSLLRLNPGEGDAAAARDYALIARKAARA